MGLDGRPRFQKNMNKKIDREAAAEISESLSGIHMKTYSGVSNHEEGNQNTLISPPTSQ